MMAQHRLMRRPEPVDFFRVLCDLKYAGYSTSAVSVILNLPESTVRTWKSAGDDGKRRIPNYDDGRALVMLYEQVFRRNPPEIGHKATFRLIKTHNFAPDQD